MKTKTFFWLFFGLCIVTLLMLLCTKPLHLSSYSSPGERANYKMRTLAMPNNLLNMLDKIFGTSDRPKNMMNTSEKTSYSIEGQTEAEDMTVTPIKAENITTTPIKAENITTAPIKEENMTITIEKTEYMRLLNTKISINAGDNTEAENIGLDSRSRKTFKYLVKKIRTKHVVDSSGTYIIIPNVAVPERKSTNELISLCSQASANHLHYLKQLTEIWQKPISVTVFTHDKDAVYAMYAITYLHTCFESVRSTVSFHLAYPVLYPPAYLDMIKNMEIHCDGFKSLQIGGNTVNYDNRIPYPHNILRNIAIQNANTPYVLLIDIDLLPSMNLAQGFTEFIQQNQSEAGLKEDNDEHIAYIVPTFESSKQTIILDKTEIKYQWEKKRARPFHVQICLRCHAVTNYKKWLDLPITPQEHVGYRVEWKDDWEPFYIAKKNNLPLFDGRFKQYGWDRISQVYELHASGYKFDVLSNGFLVHRGFKEPGGFYSQKDADNDQNNILYYFFKKDLQKRYKN